MERHISGNTYIRIGGEPGNWDKGERFKGGKKENGRGGGEDEGKLLPLWQNQNR